MDLNQLTRDADDLIRKVVSRYNQLYVPSGTISQVELDLMLDDMRKLYDTFKTIGHINLTLLNESSRPQVLVNQSQETEQQETVSATPLYNEESIQTPEEPLETQKTYVEPTFSTELAEQLEEATEPAIILHNDSTTLERSNFDDDENLPKLEFEPTLANEELKLQGEAIVQQEEQVKAAPEASFSSNNPEPQSATLAEKFSTGSKSLSETISPSQTGMGPRVFFQPITDLSSAIGLNDKFRFISELFDNDVSQYDEAITRINRAVNHDEASWILQKYHSNIWIQHSETLSRLKDFIRRRFV
jgi:hypothetical protein